MIDIIIVTYNNEDLILNNIKSVVLNTKSDFSLTIVNDSSSDDTFLELQKIKELCKSENLKQIKIINNIYPKYETKCENDALKVAKSKYAILLQADMLIRENAFDLKLIRAMEKYNDLLLVSGRAGQNLSDLKESFFSTRGFQRLTNKNILKHYYARITKPSQDFTQEKSKTQSHLIDLNDLDFLESGNIGKVGVNSQGQFKNEDLNGNKIYICNSVIRGPLIIDLEKFRKLGYFDQRHFFQGWDDHDACLRGNVKFGWRVGFIPIQYFSDITPKKYTEFRFKKGSVLNELLIFIKIVKLRVIWRKSLLYQFFTEQIEIGTHEIREY